MKGLNEMDDNMFWVRVWRTLAWMVVGITISIGGCVTADTLVTNAAIADMVEKGADPMAAACAVSNNSSFTTRDRSMRCAIVAAKGAK